MREPFDLTSLLVVIERNPSKADRTNSPSASRYTCIGVS